MFYRLQRIIQLVYDNRKKQLGDKLNTTEVVLMDVTHDINYSNGLSRCTLSQRKSRNVFMFESVCIHNKVGQPYAYFCTGPCLKVDTRDTRRLN